MIWVDYLLASVGRHGKDPSLARPSERFQLKRSRYQPIADDNEDVTTTKMYKNQHGAELPSYTAAAFLKGLPLTYGGTIW
jgi:hypothetical protein